MDDKTRMQEPIKPRGVTRPHMLVTLTLTYVCRDSFVVWHIVFVVVVQY